MRPTALNMIDDFLDELVDVFMIVSVLHKIVNGIVILLFFHTHTRVD